MKTLMKKRAELIAHTWTGENVQQLLSRSPFSSKDDVKTMLNDLGMDGQSAWFCSDTEDFIKNIASKDAQIAEQLIESDLELLQPGHRTKTDKQVVSKLGTMHGIFPIRLGRKVVGHVYSGHLCTREFTNKEISRMADAAGLAVEKVQKRVDKLPVMNKQQLDQVWGACQKLRNAMELMFQAVDEADQTASRLVQSERVRSLGTLSSGVAHHFNGLLSVILGYSSFVLNRERLSPSVTSALRKISEAAQRGRRMTEELLAFSGSDVEEAETSKAHEIIRNVLMLLQAQLPSRIHVTTRLDARYDEVQSVPSEFHQVVFNLVTNAIDALSSKGELIVETANADMDAEDAGSAFFKMRVSSLGKNIGTEDAPDETGDKPNLKLSSVYGAVGRMEGTVVVSEDSDNKTTVDVFLPLVSKKDEKEIDEPTAIHSGDRRVWIVDDDPIFREMCSVVLSEEGHQVEEITGGQEMHDKWNYGSLQPDLLIVDFSMPDYNGLELCQWLQEQKAHVPVILVSGLSPQQPDIRKALNLPGVQYLQKPFSFRELSDIVSMAMGDRLIENT